MKKTGLMIFLGIALIIYGLSNLAAGYGHYLKGQMVTSSISFGDSVNKMTNSGYSSKQQKQREDLQSASFLIYIMAFVIFVTAIMNFVSCAGLFSGQPWVGPCLIITGVLGIIVEAQDVMEDGFGFLTIIWASIVVLCFVVGSQVNESVKETVEVVNDPDLVEVNARD